MHELGIATRIADVVTRVMEQNSAEAVGEITLEIGLLSGVDSSSLEFCFAAITKGTRLEEAHLRIEKIQPKARCRGCGDEYEVRLDDFRCKFCNSSDFDVLTGREISIKQVEVG